MKMYSTFETARVKDSYYRIQAVEHFFGNLRCDNIVGAIMKTKITLKEFLMMLIGMFLMSLAIYYVMMPDNLVLGSLSGLVLVLVNFIPVKVSTLTLILNVILLIIGYVFIGRSLD